MSDLLGYKLPEIPETVTQEWISQASELDLSIARSQGKVTGAGIYAKPVGPKPERQYPLGKPTQYTRDDLKHMSSDDIVSALQAGQLDDIIGR